MILTQDPENIYINQLTIVKKSIEQLEFAVKHFRNNTERHCIIKEHVDNGYAVFTDGKYSTDILYSGSRKKFNRKNSLKFKICQKGK